MLARHSTAHRHRRARPGRHSRPCICLDFDGVLARYDGVWRGPRHHGRPLPGVKRFLQALAAADIDVVVLTTRTARGRVRQWFRRYGLPPPRQVTDRKVPAKVYVDDRAVNFDGDFDRLRRRLARFSVYWNPHHRPLLGLAVRPRRVAKRRKVG